MRWPQAFKEITDSGCDGSVLSRILIWYNGFLCAKAHGIFTDFPFAWGNPAPSGAMKSVTNPRKKRNPWKDKIRRISVIRDKFWTWAKEPVGSWALGWSYATWSKNVVIANAMTTSVQRGSRIAQMRRICSFTDFIWCSWIVCAYRAQGFYRILRVSKA